MALRLGALYDALLDATGDASMAQRASEEVAAYEHRLAGIETKLTVLTWMVTLNIALTVSLLWIVTTLQQQSAGIAAAVEAISRRVP